VNSIQQGAFPKKGFNLFVPNLFCDGWSAKFILQRLECKIYFAKAGVQNLFCKGLIEIDKGAFQKKGSLSISVEYFGRVHSNRDQAK